MAWAFAAWMACQTRVMWASSEPGRREEAMDQRESPGATVTVSGRSASPRGGGSWDVPSRGAEAGVASVAPVCCVGGCLGGAEGRGGDER